MKKLMAIALAVVMLIAMFAVVGPVSAVQPDPSERGIYEAGIVPVPWVTPTPPLDEGEVKVWADGSVEIKLKGAQPDTEYHLTLLTMSTPWVGYWTSPRILYFTTDGNGDCEQRSAAAIVPSSVVAPVFAINFKDTSTNQYVSGW